MIKLFKISLMILGGLKALELLSKAQKEGIKSIEQEDFISEEALDNAEALTETGTELVEQSVEEIAAQTATPSNLGMVDDTNRPVKDGTPYDPLIDEPNHHEKILLPNATIVNDTVPAMQHIINRYYKQVSRLAKQLEQPKQAETLQAIWQFVYDYLGYKLDKEGVEQLRTPARLWSDVRSGGGGDCDCLTIFTGSIFKNLNIPFVIRIVDFNQGWQHVYPVALIDGKEYPMDTVIHEFNYEKPYTNNRDFNG